MNMVTRGKLFDADVCTLVICDRYYVRIEATQRASAFLFALGIEHSYIGPEQDSGRAWYQIEYSADFDLFIRNAVDVLVDIRYSKPSFGQLLLFDAMEQ